MRDDLERFLNGMRETPHLVAELRALIETPDEAIRWASDRGFRLTSEDIADLRESEVELSVDELDQAAGGEDDWGSGGAPPPPGGG